MIAVPNITDNELVASIVQGSSDGDDYMWGQDKEWFDWARSKKLFNGWDLPYSWSDIEEDYYETFGRPDKTKYVVVYNGDVFIIKLTPESRDYRSYPTFGETALDEDGFEITVFDNANTAKAYARKLGKQYGTEPDLSIE